MSRVAVAESIFRPTSPVRFASGMTVYLYERGTTTKAPVYDAEEGGVELTQPLTTDAAGKPKKNGKTAYVAVGSYDLKVGGETLMWEAVAGASSITEAETAGLGDSVTFDGTFFIPSPKTVLDACDWIGKTETTSDRGPQWNKALTASYESGRELQMPPFQIVVSEPGIVESFRSLMGHPGASKIKVGDGSNCAALKSARYGAGGESGGTERCKLRDLDVDGNFAGNPGVTEPAIALDGIRPDVAGIFVRNGYENFVSKMSRTASPGTSVPEDGIFDGIVGFDSQVKNINIEGPHDSQISNVLARTNEGLNIVSNGTALVWTNPHAYGNATYALWGSGVFHGLIAEGGKSGQVKVLGDSSKFFNPWLFDGGGADGKIGFVFGDSEHSANTTLIVGAKIDNCINGALVFNRSAANSYISGLISAASGNIATEVTNASPKLNIDALRVTGGCVNNLATRTKSSQAEVEPPFCPEVELTGTSEVTTLKPSYAGHVLRLRLTSTAKIKDNGGTLNLAGDFTGPGMLTLACDGTNFREMARAAI